MRKIAAFLVCTALIFGLCGCVSRKETSAELQEILTSLKESQYLLGQYELSLEEQSEDASVDFCWNRQTTLWAVIPAEPTASDILLADAVGSMCEACGWTYEKRQLEDGEDARSVLLTKAVKNGSVGAVVFCGLPESAEDELLEAARKGVMVFSAKGDGSLPLAGSVVLSERVLAEQSLALAEAWNTFHAKDSGDSRTQPVAVNTMGCEDDGWSTAVEDAFAHSNTLFTTAFSGASENDVFDDACDWARETISEDKDMRIFLCRTPEAAYGVCCYLEQYCADKKYDLADYCVIWVGQDDLSSTYLTAAAEDPSCTAAKGCILYGDTAWETAAKLGSELLGIAYGTLLPAEIEDIWATLSENGVEPPETLSDWEWGMDAWLCTDAYASFDDYTATLFAHTNTPLADIYNICAN